MLLSQVPEGRQKHDGRFCRPSGTENSSHTLPRTYVLGYYLPSLRD